MWIEMGEQAIETACEILRLQKEESDRQLARMKS